jgi:hypothetical protein
MEFFMGPGSNNILPFSRGNSRTPKHYQKLKAPLAFRLASAFLVIPVTLATLTVGSRPGGQIYGSRIKQPFEPALPSLTQADVLLKYAQDIERHYKRPDLMPSRSLAYDYTKMRAELTWRQGKRPPPPTPTQTPSSKGKAAAAIGIMAGAGNILSRLIPIPPPPNGKGTHMLGRARCMDDEFSAEIPKPT